MKKLLIILFVACALASAGWMHTGIISGGGEVRENFTTYTETDGPGKVGVTAFTITVTDGDRDEDYYVGKDFGASYFGDFTHKIDVNLTSVTSSTPSGLMTWGLAETYDDFNDIDIASGDVFTLFTSRATSTTHYKIAIISIDGGALTTVDTSINIAINTPSYLTIIRSTTTGTVEIYSSDVLRTAAAGGDVDTITGTVVGTAFRWVYPLGSYNDGNTAADVTGTVSNLTLVN